MTPDITPGGDEPRLPPARPRVRRVAVNPPAPVDPEAPPPAAANYEVGYKKPPVHTQFQPGRSGNPNGRPRGAKGINTIVRDTMTAKVAVRTTEGTRKMTRMEVVIQKTLERALKDNQRAVDLLVRLYAAAVPDRVDEGVMSGAEDLTASDLAVLDALRRSLGGPAEPAAPGPVVSDPPDRRANRDLPEEACACGTEPPPPSQDHQWASDWDREV
jgi:hypothetical protein